MDKKNKKVGKIVGFTVLGIVLIIVFFGIVAYFQLVTAVRP